MCHPKCRLQNNLLKLVLHACGQSFVLSFLSFPAHVHPYNLKGGNTESQKRIVDEEKYITFSEALVCLKDPDVHPKLQSYYLDFVMSVFVHPAVETSCTDIENIWRSYVSLPMCAFMIYFLTSTSLFSQFFHASEMGRYFSNL